MVSLESKPNLMHLWREWDCVFAMSWDISVPPFIKERMP